MNPPSRPTSLTQMKPGPAFQGNGLPKPPQILDPMGLPFADGNVPRSPALTPPPPAGDYDVQTTGLAGPIRTHNGREVAPQLKFQIEYEMIKEFTWKERIRVLFGCNAIIKGSIMCRHNPGVVAPAVLLTVEDQKINKLSLDDLNRQLKDRMRGVFARSKKLKLKDDNGQSK